MELLKPMNSISATAFSFAVLWFVLALCYKAFFYFVSRFRRERNQVDLMSCICSFVVMIVLVPALLTDMFFVPIRRQAVAEYYGAPIVSQLQSLEGKIFTPQAFVITEQRILVYDKDNKVYALDGIKLDGLRPEELTVSSKTSYAVYRKGSEMFFGKL